MASCIKPLLTATQYETNGSGDVIERSLSLLGLNALCTSIAGVQQLGAFLASIRVFVSLSVNMDVYTHT